MCFRDDFLNGFKVVLTCFGRLVDAKAIPKSDKNGAPEGPWTSVLVPQGDLDRL